MKKTIAVIIFILSLSLKILAFYCPYCGAKLDNNYKFCSHCGNKIELDEINVQTNITDNIKPQQKTNNFVFEDITENDIYSIQNIHYDEEYQNKNKLKIISKNSDVILNKLKKKLKNENNKKKIYFFSTSRANASKNQFWRWCWLTIPWDIATYPLLITDKYLLYDEFACVVSDKKKNQKAIEYNKNIYPLITKREQIIDNENKLIEAHNKKIEQYEIDQEKIRQKLAEEERIKRKELKRIRLQKLLSKYGDTSKDQILNVAREIIRAKKEAANLYRTVGYTERVKELVDIQRDLAEIFGQLYSIVSQEPDFWNWYQRNQYILKAIQYQY